MGDDDAFMTGMWSSADVFLARAVYGGALDFVFTDDEEEEDEEGDEGGGDAHNVHDHGVASGVRAAAAEVREALRSLGGEVESAEETATEVEGALHFALESGLGAGLLGDCMAFVDSLGSQGYDAFAGLSERRMLASVWKHIRLCPAVSEPLRADMRETLVREMAEGIEGGRPVCATGKMARILSAYDGTGVLSVRSRPLWAVRQEIAELAARHRAGEEGDGREAFEAAARAEYVDAQGMSASVIDPIVAEYAAHL